MSDRDLGLKEEFEYSDEDYSDEEEEDNDKHPLAPVDLDPDTFGMSVCAITRDGYFLARQGFSPARTLRLLTSLFLAVFTFGCQIWLLMKVKEFVTARQVHDIRIAYDTFELAIYGEENCTVTLNGKHRGIPDRLPPLAVQRERLFAMSEGDQDDACRIPLSQPYFFGLILVIWTLTCIYEFRKAFNLELTILMLPRIDSMALALKHEQNEEDANDFVIKGMTHFHKAVLTIVVFIPRVTVCGVLLWLGCRWLLATNSFGDLILNAVALEFIMLIKEVIYNALMPFRNQQDLTATQILPYPKHLGSDWWSFVNTVFLLIVTVLWIHLYMVHLQSVLPNYNWDVSEVCKQYICERYKVSPETKCD